jgi:hypothetical protein
MAEPSKRPDLPFAQPKVAALVGFRHTLSVVTRVAGADVKNTKFAKLKIPHYHS